MLTENQPRKHGPPAAGADDLSRNGISPRPTSPSRRESRKTHVRGRARESFAGAHTQDGCETFVLNLGPQHPATHGVLRVKLTMDGEFIMRGRTGLRLHPPDAREDGREPHLRSVPAQHEPH